jgi:glycosyltransferase involved in cell wall biosynthesis
VTATVSIIICTRSRAEHLHQTLGAIASICLPRGLKAELIVVDNASTDNTVQVVMQCGLTNMHMRYLYEPRHGQCNARNLGLQAAQGEMIVFTDDDVRPSLHWLEKLCAPLLCGDAQAVAGGITIAQHLNRPNSPAGHWIRLASTEATDPFRPDLIGANMAFCRSVLHQVPHFDTELGPGALGFGDDTLFGWQLCIAGFQIVFAPEATTEHHFEASRLTRRSLVAMAQKQGRSAAYLAYHWRHEDEAKAPLFLIKRSVRLTCLQVLRRQETRRCSEAPGWELNILRDIAYYRQFMIERKRPRNYEKYGLLKTGQSSN